MAADRWIAERGSDRFGAISSVEDCTRHFARVKSDRVCGTASAMSGRMPEFFGLRVYPLESDIGTSMRRERIFSAGSVYPRLNTNFGSNSTPSMERRSFTDLNTAT